MFLGRFYEDKWQDKIVNALGEGDRKKSVQYYQKYLNECPTGIRKSIVEYELSLVSSKEPDSQKYLISK
jgi:hypothetical protein